MVCWTLTVTVHSVAGNGLLETDSDFVQCSREWSCWTLTVTLYCVVGNGLLDTDGDCVQCSREISC